MNNLYKLFSLLLVFLFSGFSYSSVPPKFKMTIKYSILQKGVSVRYSPHLGSPTNINLNATFAPEGKYNSLFNLLTKRDSVSVFLRRASAPFHIIDSSRRILDSITFSNTFTFFNAGSGRYYIVVKHYQCIETWSKSGGEPLISNGPTYDYDFTSNSSQAYGNNLKLKGSKFCIYSGDLNQDGFIKLDDVLQIYNDIVGFTSGNTVTDLNGDKIVDLSDLLMVSVNAQSFVSIRRP